MHLRRLPQGESCTAFDRLPRGKRNHHPELQWTSFLVVEQTPAQIAGASRQPFHENNELVEHYTEHLDFNVILPSTSVQRHKTSLLNRDSGG